MIIIDLEGIDFSPLLREGCEFYKANIYIKIATKLFVGADLTDMEYRIMEEARDFCIAESVKNEITFK